MKRLTPYLSIRDVNSLIEFYDEVFRAKLQYKTTYGEMPVDDMDFSDEEKGLVAFAKINFPNGDSLFKSKIFPEMPDIVGTKLSLHIGYEEEDALRNIFDKLAEGGEIIMPLEKTFWASLYGVVRDILGIEWGLELLDEGNILGLIQKIYL